MTAEQLTIQPEALSRIISRYTREAGVRELERMLGRIARKVARRFAEGNTEPVTVGVDDLADLLGPERVRPEHFRKELPPGVSTGLAWTEAGGDVLYVEATPAARRPRSASDRPARRRDAGIGAAPRSRSSGRTPRRWASTRTCSATAASTSTFRPARCPRTVPRPAWPW